MWSQELADGLAEEEMQLLKVERRPPNARPWRYAALALIAGMGMIGMLGLVLTHSQPKALLASTSGEVQGLAAVPSEQTCGDGNFTVCKAPGAFCTDAVCTDAPLGGISNCSCWKQASWFSFLPDHNNGAPCWAGTGVYGAEMCKRMKEGEIWSTFFRKNSSYYAPLARAMCPPKTPFAYCWGAKCVDDPDDEKKAICFCPVIASKNETEPQRITIPASQCGAGIDFCSKTYNSRFTKGPAPKGGSNDACFDYRTES